MTSRGQSLIEVLIAVTVGVLMIGVVITFIAPVLRSDTHTSRAQTAASLSKELLDNVRVISEANWHNIDGLTFGSSSRYYIATTTPFSVVIGTESVSVGTTTYKRYFYIDNVCRDSSDRVTVVQSCISPNKNDPSTKKVTVVYTWPPASTSSISQYLTRSQNRFFIQTDWSGGPGSEGPVTSTGSRFSTSSLSPRIDYTSSTGSIIIQGF
ncbi:MAG: hypothetical protein HYT13_02775 [Candidatus Liptonbacteria bacterium]|nr:hypothetical protein [Candidatus Liptonbacteria bacterium]